MNAMPSFRPPSTAHLLCDIAMCGDHGIGEAYGYSLCRCCGNGQAYRNAETGE